MKQSRKSEYEYERVERPEVYRRRGKQKAIIAELLTTEKDGKAIAFPFRDYFNSIRVLYSPLRKLGYYLRTTMKDNEVLAWVEKRET